MLTAEDYRDMEAHGKAKECSYKVRWKARCLATEAGDESKEIRECERKRRDSESEDGEPKVIPPHKPRKPRRPKS